MKHSKTIKNSGLGKGFGKNPVHLGTAAFVDSTLQDSLLKVMQSKASGKSAPYRYIQHQRLRKFLGDPRNDLATRKKLRQFMKEMYDDALKKHVRNLTYTNWKLKTGTDGVIYKNFVYGMTGTVAYMIFLSWVGLI